MDLAKEKIMITGATGYVGGRLMRALAAQGAALVLPIRANSEAEFAVKSAALRATLSGSAQPQTAQARIQLVRCDLADAAAVAALPADCTVIVHAAAVTRFNVSAEDADRHNREASGHVFALARRSPRLNHLVYVSTVYAAGEATGMVAESVIAQKPSFANHYERSKWETERLLARDFSDLPWSILRVATVIADDDAGGLTQLNVVHNTLKLLYYGLISLVPGAAEVPIYLVCGDFVEAGALAVLASAQRREVYHLCHAKDESLTLHEFIECAFAAFNADPSFARRGLQRPLLVDEASFRILADGVEGFGSAVLSEALGSMTPFARQLFLTKEFRSDKLRALLPAYQTPPPERVITQAIRRLIAQRWKVSP